MTKAEGVPTEYTDVRTIGASSQWTDANCVICVYHKQTMLQENRLPCPMCARDASAPRQDGKIYHLGPTPFTDIRPGAASGRGAVLGVFRIDSK